MVLLVTVILLAVAAWRGAPTLALVLMAAGLAVHLGLVLGLARASLGGVGGHAEWVRAVSTRPRLGRSPGWLVGTLLVVAGLAVVVWG